MAWTCIVPLVPSRHSMVCQAEAGCSILRHCDPESDTNGRTLRSDRTGGFFTEPSQTDKQINARLASLDRKRGTEE